MYSPVLIFQPSLPKVQLVQSPWFRYSQLNFFPFHCNMSLGPYLNYDGYDYECTLCDRIFWTRKALTQHCRNTSAYSAPKKPNRRISKPLVVTISVYCATTDVILPIMPMPIIWMNTIVVVCFAIFGGLLRQVLIDTLLSLITNVRIVRGILRIRII